MTDIPQEWLQKAFDAYEDETDDRPDVDGIEAALAAVIPLMRRGMALDQIASDGQWCDLMAERDRYREALERIATDDYGDEAMVEIARQALEGASEEGK